MHFPCVLSLSQRDKGASASEAGARVALLVVMDMSCFLVLSLLDQSGKTPFWCQILVLALRIYILLFDIKLPSSRY